MSTEHLSLKDFIAKYGMFWPKRCDEATVVFKTGHADYRRRIIGAVVPHIKPDQYMVVVEMQMEGATPDGYGRFQLTTILPGDVIVAAVVTDAVEEEEAYHDLEGAWPWEE